MRATAIWCLLVIFLWAAPACGQGGFPYEAYVNKDGAPVRSGPGQVHYATDYLDRGSKVEVYRHDPGGWCAIRPPAGSFSWVRADQIQLTDDQQVGEVTKQGAMAWVGSQVEQIDKPLWQVRLKKGELVEILGQRSLPAAGGGQSQTWYKIAPPAGEFRWIEQKHLDRQKPAAAASGLTIPAATDPETVPPATGQSGPPPLLLPGPASQPAPPPEPAQAAPSAAAPSDPEQPPPSGVNGRPTASETQQANPAPSAAAAPAASAAAGPAAAAPSATQTPVADFATVARQIDIELSRTLARPVDQWDFAQLRAKAMALLGRAQTDLQRGKARLLVDKIDQFAQLKRQLEQPAPAAESAVATETPAADSPEPEPVAQSALGLRQPGLVDDIDPRFDGVGRLAPVHASSPNVPAYALLDKEGNVLQYVTPAPGLNLHRYLRLEVGIYGQRGYIEQLKAPHLTAHRIVVLDRHRR